MANGPPSWLNNDYLAKALRHEANDPSIRIISSEICPGTAAGDNYSSDILRATMKIERNGQVQETSVIIKTMAANYSEEITKFMEESMTFIKETQCFAVVMPTMQEMLKKVKQKTFEPFAAKHVFSTSSPEPDAIVLQDLKREEFKLPQVDLGLDLNHSLLVMRTIARFHACSVALYQSRPELLKSFETSMQVSYSNPYFKNFMASNLKTVSQELERLTEYKKYCSVLDSLVDTCQDRFIEAGTRDDNSFNVLIHGDLWFNNMMFKYNEETGDVQAVRFVDFQLNYHTSPVVDLLYFFNTSVSPDVLQNHDILIEEYCQTLCEILTDIGYGDFKPTKELLVSEFNKKAIIGVLAGLTVRVVAFTEKAPDMEKLVNNEERVFLSDRYLRAVKKLLPMYEKLGWLTL